MSYDQIQKSHNRILFYMLTNSKFTLGMFFKKLCFWLSTLFSRFNDYSQSLTYLY